MSFISCGASGADEEWLNQAILNGHNIIQCKSDTISYEELFVKYYDKTIHLNKTRLHRSFPCRNTGVNALLMRNVRAADMTESLYAVGNLIDSENVLIDGGTAWACNYFLMEGKTEFYFFNQGDNKWYEYNMGKLLPIYGKPPAPDGIWLGIGSRKLTNYGIQAIRNIF